MPRSAFRPSPLLAVLLLASGAARAQNPPPPSSPSAPAPVPYSLPFQLRPAAVGNGLRLDTSVASWENASGRSGTTWVSGLIGTRKLTAKVALLGRVSFIASTPPSGGAETQGRLLSNPLLGATFLATRPSGLRRGVFLAATLPIGGGGGDSPKPGPAAALPRAIATRSAMDNALFATNYFTLIAGGTLARVTPQATIQFEATLLRLLRVRGPKSQDSSRTNFTSGVHLGRFFNSRVSGAAELRYQRWLTDAAPVRSNPRARETVTLAVGPRWHFKLGGRRWIRPAATFSWALDDPLKAQKYRIFQIDLPMSF